MAKSTWYSIKCLNGIVLYLICSGTALAANECRIQVNYKNYKNENTNEYKNVNKGNAADINLSGIPAQWPSDIPKPPNLSKIGGTLVTDDKRTNIDLWGRIEQADDRYFSDYVGALKKAGFSELSVSNEFDMNRGQYEMENYYLTVGTTIVNARTKRQYTEFGINLVIRR